MTKCTHSRVLGLRLECNLVWLFRVSLLEYICHNTATFNCLRLMTVFLLDSVRIFGNILTTDASLIFSALFLHQQFVRC